MIYKEIMQNYCLALKENDYEAMMKLFSAGAKVFSLLAGEKPFAEFFRDLFKNSTRNRVAMKIFIMMQIIKI